MTREDGIGFCPECGRRATWVTLNGAGGCEVHGRIQLNWERPLPTVEVRDFEGTRVAVGQRVIDDAGREVGTVVEITDADADWSDRAERAIERGPWVAVEYDEGGDVQRWVSVREYDRDGHPKSGYVCDDVLVKEDS